MNERPIVDPTESSEWLKRVADEEERSGGFPAGTGSPKLAPRPAEGEPSRIPFESRVPLLGAARRYRQLMTELLLERSDLPMDQEIRRRLEISRYWSAMTEEERQAASHALAASIRAPEHLPYEDRRVERDRHDLPRMVA